MNAYDSLIMLSEEDNLQKRLKQLDQATYNCEQKIAQYQHISDVLDLMLPSLYFFDLTTGVPRTPQSVKTDLLIFMDFLEQLNLAKLQVQTQNIRAHIDGICVCYQQVLN